MGTVVARWLDRWAVATGYVTALVITAVAVAAQPDARRRAWLDWASTNLANLHDHPVRAMAFSAVASEGNILGWVAMGLIGLGACGAALGAWRTLLLVTAAHVLGTVVSQGIVDHRIAHGTAGLAAAYMRDIGPSYVVTAAIVAGVAYGRRWGRLACAACLALLLPGLFGGLPRLSVASVGHACAVVVALGLGGLLRWSVRRRRGTPEGPHSPATARTGATGTPTIPHARGWPAGPEGVGRLDDPAADGGPDDPHAVRRADPDGDGGAQTRYSTSQ
jgi:hypothetical protein